VTCTHANPVYVRDQCLASLDGADVTFVCSLPVGHPGDHWDFLDGHWRAEGGEAVPGRCDRPTEVGRNTGNSQNRPTED
jgi:hypothetical protein